MSWYIKCLKNYFNFSGRASRQEFWMFVLFNVIASVVMTVIDRAAGLTYADGRQGVLHTVYTLFVLIPSIAVAARRLHDIGKSGLYLFVGLVPCIGGFLLLYWYIVAGEPGSNMYGPDPKSLNG